MSLNSNKAGVLELSGELTFNSVAPLYLDSRSVGMENHHTVDLAGVSHVDSAGLALLLEWQSAAKKRNQNLSFTNAPSDLLRIAALTESTTLLGLEARAEVQERAE